MIPTNTYECADCKDSGIIHEGHDCASTTFCSCDEGDATFEGWADGESARACENSSDDYDYGAGDDYSQNDAGEWNWM